MNTYHTFQKVSKQRTFSQKKQATNENWIINAAMTNTLISSTAISVHMRAVVLTTVKMLIVIFWVVKSCSTVVVNNTSEEHRASISLYFQGLFQHSSMKMNATYFQHKKYTWKDLKINSFVVYLTMLFQYLRLYSVK
jgi:hypothetical protein